MAVPLGRPRPALLEEVLTAHGGLERWRRVRRVEAEISFGGLAFLARLAPAPRRRLRLRLSPDRPQVRFESWGSRGQNAVFERGSVRLESCDGATVSARAGPLALPPAGRRPWGWDRLDVVAFAGYAVWNYLTTPFLLAAAGVRSFEGERVELPTGSSRALHVRFPPSIPTHSRDQTFYFDAERRLVRLDYVAEPFSPHARAAHWCHDYRRFDGFAFPTRRRVVPRRADDRARLGPTLVWIRLHWDAAARVD